MIRNTSQEQLTFPADLQQALDDAVQLVGQQFLPEEITGLHRLHLFLEHYAFIAWELMTLLQQVHQTTLQLPEEVPAKERLLRLSSRMLLVAESDINLTGANTDLMAVYRKGMDSCGANSSDINTFLARMRRGEPIGAITRTLGLASGLADHACHTQQLIGQGQLHQLYAALCFAPRLPRLDLLLHLLDQLDRKLPVLLMRIRYYFDLEVMLQNLLFEPLGHEALHLLCGTDALLWSECASQVTYTARSRAALLADSRKAMKHG